MFSEKARADAIRKKAYLKGKMLTLKRFQPSYPNDHTFCAFCWAQISGFEEDYNDGFYEEESGNWVCKLCYEEFLPDFDWSVTYSDEVLDAFEDEEPSDFLVL